MAPRDVNGVVLVWVGRRGGAHLEALADEYSKRLARYLPLTQIRVPPAEGRGGDPRRALAREKDAIVRHLAPGDTVVVLDERGRERTTPELAEWLRERTRVSRTAFVVGSDLGVDRELKAASETMALSRLTLPHHLARLVLLEQLYRACDLLAGGQYHRGCLG
ncbi:MAG TPA: 23S rRNA (pseudouridine(1915)-N(3))-methyltransferase RlmH [Thermoanaerobaculaceae bacterium]|nr:23S rRNA (pseudouridine(1915)-N(3))-methyltransferase RlmH [Thermoanaerobaculaceae bacterium]